MRCNAAALSGAGRGGFSGDTGTRVGNERRIREAEPYAGWRTGSPFHHTRAPGQGTFGLSGCNICPSIMADCQKAVPITGQVRHNGRWSPPFDFEVWSGFGRVRATTSKGRRPQVSGTIETGLRL